MKTLTRIATLSVFSLATMVYAGAQAEINPDHFADAPEQAAPVVKAEVQAQINALETKVQDCEAQLQRQAEMLEETRQEVISAGIQGDGASNLMSSYDAQKAEMDLMQKSLASQIASAQRDIDMLKTQGTVVVAKATPMATPKVRKPSPVVLSARNEFVSSSRH